MTISMLALAGFPATAGFFGKIYLIDAAVDNGYAWLGVVIVLGSAVSLAYYLRVVAAVWMRSPVRGARRALAAARAPGDRRRLGRGRRGGRAPRAVEPGDAARARLVQPEVLFVAVVCAAATIFFGIYPEPLFNSPATPARRSRICSSASNCNCADGREGRSARRDDPRRAGAVPRVSLDRVNETSRHHRSLYLRSSPFFRSRGRSLRGAALSELCAHRPPPARPPWSTSPSSPSWRRCSLAAPAVGAPSIPRLRRARDPARDLRRRRRRLLGVEARGGRAAAVPAVARTRAAATASVTVFSVDFGARGTLTMTQQSRRDGRRPRSRSAAGDGVSGGLGLGRPCRPGAARGRGERQRRRAG